MEALRSNTLHPYAKLASDVGPAVAAHLRRTDAEGLPHAGDLDASLRPMPTAIGTLRPAAIVPAAQAPALAPWNGDGLLLVGIEHYRDAWAPWAARNLASALWPDGAPREVRGITVDLPWLDRLHNLNATVLARLFDDPVWRQRTLGAIAQAVPAGSWRIGLPAALGLERHRGVHADAEAALGHPCFEVPSLPPSVPGMRLFEALRRRIIGAGGRIHLGFEVVQVERDEQRVHAIHTHAGARTLRLLGDAFVLATGGLAGTGFRGRRDGTVEERIFGLHVTAPPHRAWFSDDPLQPHPLEAAGIETDDALRPPELENVRVIGSALAGMHYLSERCGDGVALASAYRVAAELGGTARAAA